MTRRPSNRSDHRRRALAVEAARLMAEHGITDFLVAKRKAAERLGITEDTQLPRNIEIEAALAEHQRLFGAEDHNNRLQQLRSTALRAMDELAAFEPRLVGAVLNGTATAHTGVQLHLFADQPEMISLHLLERGIDYEVTEKRVRLTAERTRPFPGLRFALDGEEFDATVFPRDGIRQAPLSPVDGRPMRRAGKLDVELLLSEAAEG
ncbi:MAG: hypothetical protein QM718_10945 [Steroidobacteraceae bacterium]